MKQENKIFELTMENLRDCVNIDKWQSGEWSEVATISRAIKKFLKMAGIDCKIYTQRYSGGNSVDVFVKDLPYEKDKILENLFEFAFEAGNFNGMEDIYEYRKDSNGLPQTKFLFFHNELSKDFEKKAIEYADKLGFTNITNEEKIKLVFTGYIKDEESPKL